MDKQITYTMITKWLNINESILEMIHLTDNNCCGYIDQKLFTCFNQDEILTIKNNDWPCDWCIKVNTCPYSCNFDQKKLMICLIQSLLVDEI